MSIAKDLLINALENTDPFFVYNGDLYKKYDKIEIRPVFKDVKRKIGLFNTEVEKIYDGVEVVAKYDGKVVYSRRHSLINFPMGDVMELSPLGGLIKVVIDAP